jgi:hypothetical protein
LGATTWRGKAVWACPTDGAVIVAVGSLRPTRGMKALPAWLPDASSRKWHSRRWTDSLGYLRVRTLANPNWRYELLDAVDAILAVTHRRHLTAVREAGVSGKDVPSADP